MCRRRLTLQGLLGNCDYVASLVVDLEDDEAHRNLRIALVVAASSAKMQGVAIGAFGTEGFDHANHRNIGESATLIFSRGNLLGGGIDGKSSNEPVIGVVDAVYRKIDATFLPVRVFNRQRLFGSCSGVSHRLLQLLRIAADKLRRSVHHHLRGVAILQAEAEDIVLLPLVNIVEREAVAPALMIPIGHMFTEHDCVRIRYGLL